MRTRVRGHPNVVDLVGICGPSSVSEYFAVRLDDLVLKAGAQPLPILTVVSMALDAARGLQALHEAPGGAIVHFDMKPQQLMVDDQGRLKINDLNMCSFTDADADGNTCPYESTASRVGPWRSPENIAGENLNEKLDIYSLAMVFYSMLALHPPYQGVRNASGNIKDGIPPPTDPSWHPGFLDIVRDMWQRDPNARPSARRVVQRLEFLRDHLVTQATS
ncbi:Serine/threonine-protein kinase pkn5 [Ectocarpus siliculosus]|uniref:Serine/threonine-protein kinase pkn5 n=1 Tax=Ectocarpus siliculosus TaxID=2880 RepID=D8LHZ9_ECTSI|nr:Serine/threonine-protein kinase pkn5 [Ectocarpus siliculosus]|eukprot:CBN74430.1 Serine/threonine-protein kinase pkn5 [Ectocarpus siliculosus]